MILQEKHVILSDRPEEQYKAIEWAEQEYNRLIIAKGEQIATKVRQHELKQESLEENVL